MKSEHATQPRPEGTGRPRTARPLRVLHLRGSDLLGGPERLILDHARLELPDIRTTIVSFGRPGEPHPFLDAALAAGHEAVLVPVKSSYDHRMGRHVRELVQLHAPDVVVSHDYKADLVATWAARDLPRVAVVHGYTAEDLKVRLFEAVDRQLLKRTMDAVVVVSESLRDRLVESGVPRNRIHVVHNGVDVARISEDAEAGRAALRRSWGMKEDDVVVVMLGRLSPEKGQDLALEAFARLEYPYANLLLIGDGALRPQLEARAAEPDLAGRVHLLGWRDDPAACLGAADIFLLSSRTEGLPLSLLEAMSAGRPAIATRVGAVPEVLGGGTGLLVDPGDMAGLRQALSRLISNPTARAEFGRRSSARVRSSYDVVRQARALEQIYQVVAR